MHSMRCPACLGDAYVPCERCDETGKVSVNVIPTLEQWIEDAVAVSDDDARELVQVLIVGFNAAVGQIEAARLERDEARRQYQVERVVSAAGRTLVEELQAEVAGLREQATHVRDLANAILQYWGSEETEGFPFEEAVELARRVGRCGAALEVPS